MMSDENDEKRDEIRIHSVAEKRGNSSENSLQPLFTFVTSFCLCLDVSV